MPLVSVRGDVIKVFKFGIDGAGCSLRVKFGGLKSANLTDSDYSEVIN